jgi:hypothetical protein
MSEQSYDPPAIQDRTRIDLPLVGGPGTSQISATFRPEPEPKPR